MTAVFSCANLNFMGVPGHNASTVSPMGCSKEQSLQINAGIAGRSFKESQKSLARVSGKSLDAEKTSGACRRECLFNNRARAWNGRSQWSPTAGRERAGRFEQVTATGGAAETEAQAVGAIPDKF